MVYSENKTKEPVVYKLRLGAGRMIRLQFEAFQKISHWDHERRMTGR